MKININKKKTIIVSLVFLSILGVGLFLITKKREDEKALPQYSPLPGETSIPQEFRPQITDDEKVKVSGIEMDNFYKEAVQTGEDGFALFIKETDYQIMYIPVDNSFLISILNNPFDEIKSRAEQKFLEKLAINEDEACRQEVAITTPRNVNPQEAGKIHRLSFCE